LSFSNQHTSGKEQKLIFIDAFLADTVAAYCEGKNWKLEINSSARQKFWGQSLEIIPEGLNRLTILNPKGSAESMDVYEWDKPSSFV
jgi:hypothetical protein